MASPFPSPPCSLAEALAELEGCSFPGMTFDRVRPVVSAMAEALTNAEGDDDGDGGGGGVEARMAGAIAGLALARRQTLMKVIYCCLAEDCGSAPAYLRWHAALYTSKGCGPGAVMRVLTDGTTANA